MRVLPDHWVKLEQRSQCTLPCLVGFWGHSQAKESSDEASATGTCRREDIHPRHLGRFQLNLEGRLDLSHLGLDEFRVFISLSMVLHEDLPSLVSATLGDEPSGTIRQEAEIIRCQLARVVRLTWRPKRENGIQDESNLQQGRADLEPRWDPPSVIVLNPVGAEDDASGHNLTDEVGNVEPWRSLARLPQ